ncbi:MAG: hypothetical protein WC517_00160 [Patescibacteria group bacterium]
MEKKFKHLEKNSDKNETAEEQTRVEELLEKLFDSESINKVNEGHHGAIFELDFSGLSESEKQEFCRHFQIPISDAGEVAVKMLKLYQPREAEKEFLAQEKAVQAVNGREELRANVGIPECYFGGEISISGRPLKDKLEAAGINVATDHFGVIMMDFVKGEDLGIYCYKQFIKAHFDRFKELAGIEKEVAAEEYDLYLNGESIDNLILFCHRLLGVRAKYHYLDDSFEARQERSDIANKLLAGIENKGLFDRSKIKDLRAAISAMHEQGVFHRDLHWRNIVQDKDGKLFIVDFGSAKIVEAGVGEMSSIYQSEDGRLMDKDEAILSFLQRLSVTAEEADKIKIERNLAMAVKVKNIANQDVFKSPKERKINNAWMILQESVGAGLKLGQVLREFSNNLGEYADSDLSFDYQISALLLLAENGYREKVKEFCLEKILDDKISPVFLSKLVSLEQSL